MQMIFMQGVRQRTALVQDLEFLNIPFAKSSANNALCYVCGKGLQDGNSVTAKTLPNGIVLFCNVHYS